MGVTARELVREWAARLAEAGIETARLDAELLVAHGLGIDRDRLVIDDPEPGATQLATIDEVEERVFAAAPGAAFLLARLEQDHAPAAEVELDLPISIYGGG